MIMSSAVKIDGWHRAGAAGFIDEESHLKVIPNQTIIFALVTFHHVAFQRR